MSDLPFVFVAKTEDVPANGMKCFEIDGRGVLVINAGEGVYRTIENACSHEKKPLEGGRVRAGRKIVCPHHGANFDLETGKALNPPAVLAITVFPHKVEDGSIFVQLVEGVKRPDNPFAVPGARGPRGF